MHYPEFFTTTQSITLYDPLSEFLGAFEEGLITFSYLDCVKLAGHSCPTVAGAYLMVREGLKALYKEQTPKRGEIEVFLKNAKEEGVSGVIATVFSLITGANDEGGFKGLNGRFKRSKLIHFEADTFLHVKLQRTDTKQSVEISYEPNTIAPDPRMANLMQKCLSATASHTEQRAFAQLWQERVRIILENCDKVIVIK